MASSIPAKKSTSTPATTPTTTATVGTCLLVFDNVALVGKVDPTTVADGRIADVGVHKGYSYLDTFRPDACSGPENVIDGGVCVVDIRNPASPKVVGFIKTQ
jgi:hypothetical protein